MKLYALKLNDKYEGFGLTEDLQAEIDTWTGSPVEVVLMGEGDDGTVRNVCDFFTALNTGMNVKPAEYSIDDKYTLTPAGQAFWDEHTL